MVCKKVVEKRSKPCENVVHETTKNNSKRSPKRFIQERAAADHRSSARDGEVVGYGELGAVRGGIWGDIL